MFFQRTTETTFVQVSEMPIQREHEIAELLVAYERQLETHAVPDMNLVYRAALLVQERLATIPLDTELMLLAHWVLLNIRAI